MVGVASNGSGRITGGGQAGETRRHDGPATDAPPSGGVGRDEWSDLPRSIAGLQDAYRQRQLSPVEVTRALLDRAERLQPVLNAFITLTPEQALRQAQEAERRQRRGEESPLLGVPITLKDLFDQRGVPTTAGSGRRRDAVAAADAPVVRRLFRAGAISLGKTNTHELAYGVTNINPHFGPVRNPWALDRISGGSSGGAGAAVAAGLGLVGLGSDSGGSVRIPAALCGVVGLKPTYGRVPTAGLFPLMPSLDHVGWLTPTVADAALVLHAIAGPSGVAAASRAGSSGQDGLRAGIAGLRVGLLAQLPVDVDGAIVAAVQAAAGVLERLGARLQPLEWRTLPDLAGLGAEAAAVHRRTLETEPDAIGEDVRRRLERHLTIPAVDYIAGQQTLREVRRSAGALFATAGGGRVDVVVGPTVPLAATRIDSPEDHLAQLISLTSRYNAAGLPAVSVPCGFTPNGLPIGLQIAGPPQAEATVLRVAYAYEQATDWHRRRPPPAPAAAERVHA